MIRALFGGSFDPFHRGHRSIIGELLDRELADVVHVVPAGRSPFKDEAGAGPDHRLEMTRLALAGCDGAVVEDLEIRRGGPSYTIDTLDAMRARHPGGAWRLVVGADSLAGLTRWRDAERILDEVRLIVFPRRGDHVDPPRDASSPLVVDGFDQDVSSTAVRAALDAGRVPDDLLSADVAAYIRRHRLYGCGETGG